MTLPKSMYYDVTGYGESVLCLKSETDVRRDSSRITCTSRFVKDRNGDLLINLGRETRSPAGGSAGKQWMAATFSPEEARALATHILHHFTE